MDFPRQRPEPAPPSATPVKVLRYAAASLWILALAASVNVAIVWITDWLLTR